MVESAGLLAAGEGGIVRTLKAPDGTERLVVGAMALEAGQDMPLLERGTPLQGCMHGATLQSLALVLGALHGVAVSAPAGLATSAVDQHVSGTLEEITAQFGLTVA